MVKLTIKINRDNLFTHDGIMINTKLLGKIQDLLLKAIRKFVYCQFLIN